MYLEEFYKALRRNYAGSLFSVRQASRLHPRAKEYLYRLRVLGRVERVGWGWYYIPEERDVWGFLSRDGNFKVLIKQTAASVWNYDFVHRSVYRLAVKDGGYKRALEALGRRRGWAFEVEVHDEIPYEYVRLGGLLIESLESSIVSCVAEWSFLDALAALYFRRDEIDFGKLKKIARWRRVSRSSVRVWQVIRYGCNLLNERLGRKLFKVRKASLDVDIRELVDEAVDKVMEFA